MNENKSSARKLSAILFADMNKRFSINRRDESRVDFQVSEPERVGWQTNTLI